MRKLLHNAITHAIEQGAAGGGRMTQVYIDSMTSGLVPVKPLRRERDKFGDEYIVVRVKQTRGAYPKGLEEWRLAGAGSLVVKAGRVGIHQLVRTATREEVGV